MFTFGKAILTGQHQESIEFNFEREVEGVGVNIVVSCPNENPRMELKLETIAYEYPSLGELSRLISGDDGAIFELDAVHFLMQISLKKFGVREGFLAQLWISTIKELEFFPWPKEMEQFVLGLNESIGLHQLVFQCDYDEIRQFEIELKKCFG